MSKKMLGVFTAITAALLVVGVAWASGDGTSSSSTVDDQSSSSVSSVDDSISLDSGGATPTVDGDDSATPGPGGSSTTSGPGSSSTTSPGRSTSTTGDDSGSSTTVPGGSSSTTLPGGSSSTTSDESSGVEDGIHTYEVGAAGTVTVEVLSGELILVDVATNSGWSYEVTKELPDAIDVRFERGESEAEIEIDIEDGQLLVTIG